MVIDRVFSKRHPNSIVWKDVSWGFYRAMLSEFDERPSRINYDRGTLEVMELPFEHENYKAMLGLMVGLAAMTFGIRATRGGALTLMRMAKKKGLDSDQC